MFFKRNLKKYSNREISKLLEEVQNEALIRINSDEAICDWKILLKPQHADNEENQVYLHLGRASRKQVNEARKLLEGKLITAEFIEQ